MTHIDANLGGVVPAMGLIQRKKAPPGGILLLSLAAALGRLRRRPPSRRPAPNFHRSFVKT
jgi:hypothetical protein